MVTFIIGVAAGLLVTIIVSSVRDYFSPIEKEIREIYRAVLNVEKNLEDFMKAEGHGFEKYKIEYLTAPFDKTKESAGEKYDEWSEDFTNAYVRNEEIKWEARWGRNELIKNLLNSFMEKLEEHFEKYPFPGVPVAKMNEGDQYTDVTDMEHTGGGVAIGPSEATLLDALPGAINTAFENRVPVALENAVQSVIEKTGGMVGGEGQMTKEEMIATMIEGMEEVPEQYKEIRRIVERNQTLIYSYQDQLLRLEHMIQNRALTIDQIYRKIVKKMWDEYRCGG